MSFEEITAHIENPDEPQNPDQWLDMVLLKVNDDLDHLPTDIAEAIDTGDIKRFKLQRELLVTQARADNLHLLRTTIEGEYSGQKLQKLLELYEQQHAAMSDVYKAIDTLEQHIPKEVGYDNATVGAVYTAAVQDTLGFIAFYTTYLEK